MIFFLLNMYILGIRLLTPSLTNFYFKLCNIYLTKLCNLILQILNPPLSTVKGNLAQRVKAWFVKASTLPVKDVCNYCNCNFSKWCPYLHKTLYCHSKMGFFINNDDDLNVLMIQLYPLFCVANSQLCYDQLLQLFIGANDEYKFASLPHFHSDYRIDLSRAKIAFCVHIHF